MSLDPALRKLIASGTAKYNRGGGGQRIKAKEGINRFRIIVPAPGQTPWVRPNGQSWADVGVHWIKADLNGKPQAIVGCEDIVNDQPCPICQAIDLALANNVDPDSEKLYESWKPSRSVWVNAIDRSKGSTSEDPQVLELPKGVWGKIWALAEQYAEEGQWIFDLDSGVDVAIVKSGKGFSTEYQVNVAPGNSKPVDHKVLAGLTDVFALVQKEFFRGEEQKALNVIAQISGVALPRLAAPANSNAGALSLTAGAAPAAAAAAAAAAPVQTAAQKVATPTAALVNEAAAVEDADVTTVDATVVDTAMINDVLSELDGL